MAEPDIGFFVEDVNAGSIGVCDTLEAAMALAMDELSAYRADAIYDGWDLDAGDLCIYKAPRDTDEPSDGELVARNVEFNIQHLDEPSSYFDYTCDMRMEAVHVR